MQTTHRPAPSARGNQSGAVLIVGLILLLVMTMLGLTAMQTTSLEERMAGNMRDRGIAFQAAELALRAGEQKVFDGPPTSGNGFFDFTIGKPAPDESVDTNWNSTSNTWGWTSGLPVGSTSTGSGYPALDEEPKFWIEARPGRKPLEASSPIETVYYVTARSTGASGTAPVILQSTARY